jgi:hypothetical protein
MLIKRPCIFLKLNGSCAEVALCKTLRRTLTSKINMVSKNAPKTGSNTVKQVSETSFPMFTCALSYHIGVILVLLIVIDLLLLILLGVGIVIKESEEIEPYDPCIPSLNQTKLLSSINFPLTRLQSPNIDTLNPFYSPHVIDSLLLYTILHLLPNQ